MKLFELLRIKSKKSHFPSSRSKRRHSFYNMLQKMKKRRKDFNVDSMMKNYILIINYMGLVMTRNTEPVAKTK